MNRISDQIRLEVLADPPNRDDLRALNGSCREVWTARGLLLDDAGAPLDPGLEQRIRDDLLDLVTLSADLGVRLAPAGEEAEARRDALRRLDEVEAVIGPRRALDRTRQELAEALGLADLARAAAIRVAASGTRSAGDFYDLGVSLLRRGDLGPAAEALGRASALKPQAFWPNFFRGRCAAKRSRHLDAVEAFSTCLALDPGSAPCYAHRSKSWEALGHLDRAREDLDRALTLDPRLPGVLTNRGIIKLREGRPSEAIADLTKALDLGEAAGTAHYHIALAYLRLGDRARARASALAALRVNPGHASARTLFTDLDP